MSGTIIHKKVYHAHHISIASIPNPAATALPSATHVGSATRSPALFTEPLLVLPSCSFWYVPLPPCPFDVARIEAGTVAVATTFVTLVVLNVVLGAPATSSAAAVPDMNTSAAPGAGTLIRHTAVVDDPDPEPIAVDPAAELPVTVTGFDGVPVTISDNSRIVAADQYGTLAETVFALGLGDNLVGRDTSASFPAAADVPDVTPSGHSLSAEGILALSPTVVLTELGKQAWSGPKGEAMRAKIPLRRFALPEDVAAAAVFLAGGGARMITGQTLVVDGGYTIQ